MSRAYVHLPPTVHYRREAFIDGFAKLGFIVRQEQPDRPLGPDEVAVTWNMSARSRQTIDAAKAGGGALLVAENGYVGKDANGHQFYALALGGHNGSGKWHVPDDDTRLRRLNIEFKPFRPEEGRKVVVAGQRGIGSPIMRSPFRFAEEMADKLIRNGFEPLIRPHPGMEQPPTTLAEDLEGARALVVWSSNCATWALAEGIPTYYCAPAIVTAPGARMFSPSLDLGTYPHLRYEAFHKLSWAQWSLEEIASGEAIRTLLDVHQGKLSSVGKGLDQ